MKNSHPVPQRGDIVVLNDRGIEQCFGSRRGLAHMRTKRMIVVYVSNTSLTRPEQTFPVEVDDPDIGSLLTDNWCFDIVGKADMRNVPQPHPQSMPVYLDTMGGRKMNIDMIDNSSPEGDCSYYVRPMTRSDEGDDVPCEESEADFWDTQEVTPDGNDSWIASFRRKEDALVFKGILEMGGLS